MSATDDGLFPVDQVPTGGAFRPPEPSTPEPSRTGGTSTAKGRGSVIRLKVTLRHTKPPVWRRLEVPSTIRLDVLHEVLQQAMGWMGGHLHQWETPDGGQFGEPDPGLGWGEPVVDERTRTLVDLVRSPGDHMVYRYDFGDDWEHRLVVEAVTPNAMDSERVRCVGGRRMGPPEDCGGPWGYEHLLEVLADPGHDEHDEMRDWVGPFWSATDFDVGQTDRMLAGIDARPAPLRPPRRERRRQR